MATSDSLLEIVDGRIRVSFHTEASKLTVAVRPPVTARLFYDTGGWRTIGDPWSILVNGESSGVIQYSDDDARRILNVNLADRLKPGPNTLQLVGAVWPNSRGSLLVLSQGATIAINADYSWSGSGQHDIINQTWTIDFQPE